MSCPPMIAREADALPRGEDWTYELNWGGERIRAIKQDGGVRLLAKDGRDLANRFPRVAAAVERLRPVEAVIDGEVLILDGYSQAAIARLAEVTDDISQARVALLAYDLLELHGEDLRGLTLLCRRVKLAAVVQGTPIILSPRISGTPEHALAEATRLGLIGAVAKRDGSAYRPNASVHDWLKVPAVLAPRGHTPREREEPELMSARAY